MKYRGRGGRGGVDGGVNKKKKKKKAKDESGHRRHGIMAAADGIMAYGV